MPKEHLLVLMRHAKSDWNADYWQDFDRPLSKRGHRDAARMSKWLAKQGLKSVSLISSTALRARETSEYLISGLALHPSNCSLEEKLYACDRGTILDIVKAQSRQSSRCIIVAHNPALDEVLEYLCPDSVSYTGTGKLMTTAAVAILSYTRSASKQEFESIKLRAFMRPRELE